MTLPASESDLDRISGFNRTEAVFPDHATLQELIETQVARTPDAEAVICEHDKTLGVSSLTFGQLNQRANQLAHLLRARGVKRGDIVGLLTERSFAMVIGILGILKSGAAYLPLSPENPPDRSQYMLKDAGVQVLLHHAKTRNRAALASTSLNLDDPTSYSDSAENPVPANSPTDLAYVIYTSGSTGRPKGVMIEHRSVVNRLHWMQHAYPIAASDVILQKTPYYFDVSVWELFWWALEGAKLCFLAPGMEGNPLALVKTIQKHRVTVLHFVPSMLSVFLEYLESKGTSATEELRSVRQVFASGEALTTSHVRRFNQLWRQQTGTRLTNLYGPTEATVDVTYFDCPPQAVEKIPIGRAIHNTRLYVLHEGKPVAIGETGELCIAGVQLARGYVNAPQLTAEKFIPHPLNPGERIYRTGDLARWLPDGNVEYLGREDHQVKIRGLRIELGEIENSIRGYPGITDCVAIVKRHSETVIVIVAYVVSKSGLDAAQLKTYLKLHLPSYMVPHQFVTIDQIPLTTTGKADRNRLPEPSQLGSMTR